MIGPSYFDFSFNLFAAHGVTSQIDVTFAHAGVHINHHTLLWKNSTYHGRSEIHLNDQNKLQQATLAYIHQNNKQIWKKNT
jgi:hypothetical protein